MYDVEVTEEFENWLGNIQNSKTQKVIVNVSGLYPLVRLARPGRLKAASLRQKFVTVPGSGCILSTKGAKTIVLLCGGDKSMQKQDIKRAREMAGEI